MKVLHFILGKANPDRANGVNQVINGLSKYLNKLEIEVFVIGISKTESGKSEIFQREGFQVEVYPSFYNGGYKRLKQLSQEVDIVHMHGVWNNYNIILGRYLEKAQKPYVVTVHAGMASDRLHQSNYLIKRLYHKLFQKRLYDRAAGLHAITREEITDISKYSDNKNIYIVPNGIDLNNYPFSYKASENKEVKIGYLGRLSIEKNIDNLIHSLTYLPSSLQKITTLYLIGPDNHKDADKIKTIIKQLKLDKQVVFCGGIFGQDKIKKLSELDIYVHPAWSDVVSIAAMEAMAIGLPSVITRTSQVAYYQNANAFTMVEPVAQEIARGVQQLIQNRKEWTLFSRNARYLVEQVFNWEMSAKTMSREYKKIININ